MPLIVGAVITLAAVVLIKVDVPGGVRAGNIGPPGAWGTTSAPRPVSAGSCDAG